MHDMCVLIDVQTLAALPLDSVLIVDCRSPPNSARSSELIGRCTVRYLEKMSRADSASGRSILIF